MVRSWRCPQAPTRINKKQQTNPKPRTQTNHKRPWHRGAVKTDPFQAFCWHLDAASASGDHQIPAGMILLGFTSWGEELGRLVLVECAVLAFHPRRRAEPGVSQGQCSRRSQAKWSDPLEEKPGERRAPRAPGQAPTTGSSPSLISNNSCNELARIPFPAKGRLTLPLRSEALLKKQLCLAASGKATGPVTRGARAWQHQSRVSSWPILASCQEAKPPLSAHFWGPQDQKSSCV